MATTGSFKTYERDVRYQTTQAAFVSGMYYTNTPVPEGAAKVLVNCDVSLDGTSIKPRKGLQTTRIAFNINDNLPNTSKPEVIISKACYQANKEFIQVIVKIAIPQSDDYRIAVYTIDNTTADQFKTTYKESHYYKQNGTLTDVSPIGVFSETTPEYTIHGIPCVNRTHHVGCFVNDQYFFFDKTSGKLIYTQFNPDIEQYELCLLEPQATPYSKAQQLGFNMLLKNPYTYEDTFVVSDSPVINFNSINVFDDAACTIPAQTELIENQTYYYRVSYSGGGTLQLVFDWATPDNMVWQELKTQSITITEHNIPKIVVPFRAPANKAILRCTANRTGEVVEPVDIIWFSFEYKTNYTKGFKDIVNFSLDTSTAITYWQNRLVVAGVKEDKSYLFTSSPELFEYFPFPNNADYLEEPIIAVKAFLDNLLVFTKSKLYLYTLDDMTGLTRKCIQNNLNVKEEETHLIKIVKNMAYFKSGDYYYMIVPKLNSTTGDLTIAPVYRYMKEFFDDFHSATQNILQEQYNITKALPLHTVYNYLDYEAVHNVYMFRLKEGLYINVDLLYNTVKRTWSIYTYECVAPLQVYKQDATQPGRRLCLSFLKTQKLTNTGMSFNVYNSVVQLIDWTQDCADKHLDSVITVDTADLKDAYYNNKQFIDTGAVDINSNYKKRFREIQFRVRNDGGQDLAFNTTFFIDGEAKTPAYEYAPIMDNNTGTLTLDRVLTSVLPMETTLPEVTKLGAWELSKAVFPGRDIIKIRVPVSGKGYNSQIKIHCNSQADFTLLDITNVYRQLYSR